MFCMMRIGHGYDVHQLVAERKLILGGVDIPHQLGLLGHSDADVLLHAICDAILGALGEGDIGKHFPDTDPAYKGISSLKLLHEVMALAQGKGYVLGNIDATIIAQRPKLAPFIPRMRENIAAACAADVSRINVKATTTEHLGFEGRGEGISSHAVVLLNKAATSEELQL
jgi:2-C-methyl-D-erythritol 2,4-cyclodiphosphate synthase